MTGIYEGTIGQAEYADGRDQGRRDAETLAESGLTGYWEDAQESGREAVRTAQSPRSRAFYIGWLRGFREITR